MSKVGVLCGSLRRGSYTRMVANAAIAVAPPGMECGFVEIRDLPLYDQDLEESAVPPAWTAFRSAIKRFDAILFATPEYNRSVPGALKNAIDVGSRPSKDSAWKGRPAAIISVSPGNISGFGANHHLRQSLVFLDMPTLQQPEAYIGGVAAMFGEDGALKNEGTREFLETFMETFGGWIEKTAPKR